MSPDARAVLGRRAQRGWRGRGGGTFTGAGKRGLAPTRRTAPALLPPWTRSGEQSLLISSRSGDSLGSMAAMQRTISLQEGFADLAQLPTTLQELTHSTLESRMTCKSLTTQMSAFKSEFDNSVPPHHPYCLVVRAWIREWGCSQP